MAFFAGGQLKRVDPGQRLRAEPGGSAGEHARRRLEHCGHDCLYPLRDRTAVSRAGHGREGRGRHRCDRPRTGPPVPAVSAGWPTLSVLRVRQARGQGIYIGPLDSLMATRLIDADPRRSLLRRTTCCSRDKGRCWLSGSISIRCRQSVIPLPVAREVVTPLGIVGERRAVGRRVGRSHCLPRKRGQSVNCDGWIRSGRPSGVQSPVPTRVNPGTMRSVPRWPLRSQWEQLENGNHDIWLFETTREVRQRVTTHPAREFQSRPWS